MVESFGEALHRLRQAAGLSQPALSRRVPISQTSLSRYEHDRQAVDPRTADRLDELLNAGGALRALLPPSPCAVLTPDDGDRIVHAVAAPSRVDRRTVDALADVLVATRRLEDATSAAAVLPMVRQQLATVRSMTAEAPSAVRPAAASVASQCSQYLGWLLLATGHGDQAVGQFDAAISLGAEADDPTSFAHGLSFKAYAALLAEQPGTAASLSAAARRDRRVYLPMRAYDAYQEALALATEADEAAALRVLGEGNDLAAAAAEDDGEAPAGAYWYTPSFLQAQHGLVLLRLGRHDQAADLLALGLDAWPDELRNTEWAASYQAELEAARSV
jgi:transcriptional regulator with XRE-family HTH domain